MKQYYANGKTYTFDITEETEVKVPMWYAKCRENGKMAWLDREGIQFEGEKRFQASTEPATKGRYITYEYDPLYPDDCIPVTRFHDTFAEAEAYAKNTMWQFDICVDIYEAKPCMMC